MTMKQKIRIQFAALAVVLCFAVCGVLPAFAAVAGVDPDRTGSVSVTLYDRQNEVPLRGGRLTLYKVAQVQTYGGGVRYVYTGDFKGCTAELGDLSDSGLAAQLEAYLPAAAQGTTRTVSEEGKATFRNLEVGVYLLVQTEASHGYAPINSFVVSVPLLEDGSWTYDVDASPKVGTVAPDETPDEPDTPDTPDTPGTPDTPAPVIPVPTPGTDQPTQPDIPDLPVTPGDADNPVSPGNPDNPALPAAPDNPALPGNPDGVVLPGRPDAARLPQSGQLNWPIPVFACGGTLMFAVGWTLDRKEEPYETEDR